MDHSILISISLWVPKHVDAKGVLPFFFFSSTVSFHSPMKDKKGLATRYSICGYTNLECTLLFVPATAGLLKPDS